MNRMFQGSLFLICLGVAATLSAVPFTLEPIPTVEPTAPDTPVEPTVLYRSTSAAGDSTYVLCLEHIVNPFGFTGGGASCWGWEAPDGSEYAMYGIDNGVAFIEAATGIVRDTVLGPSSACSYRWREMKSYRNYAYVVSECIGSNQGMMIIDMSYLPDSVHLVTTYSTGTDVTSHCITIDTAKAFVYLVKSNYSGFRVISLANPTVPVEFPYVFTGAIHDMTARNDTVWVAEATAHSFSVWNMANKNAPQFITRVTIPAGGYVHNLWPMDGRTYIASTEETAGKTVKFWDVSDYNNVQLVGQYLGPSNMAHNVHFERGLAYLSHYQSGVVTLDVTNPALPVELARYDTYTAGESSAFAGCWGIYPHTRSGRIFASNMDGRLFILQEKWAQTDATMEALDVYSGGATQVTVPVNLANGSPVSEIIIPFTYAGPANVVFDTFFTTGLRTDYFQTKKYTAFDPNNKRMAIQLKVNTLTSPELQPGSGPVIHLRFNVPASTNGAVIPIRLVTINANNPRVTNTCYSITPDTVQGSITLGLPTCCVGTVGNIDNSPDGLSDASDLQYLVDYIFFNGPGAACAAEANVDLSPGNVVDPSDLQFMVDYVFFGTPPTLPNCP